MACMEDLGVELLTRILETGHFSLQQLAQLRTMSREWREACQSTTLWNKLELQVPRQSCLGLTTVAKYCNVMEELHLSRDPLNPRALSLTFSASWLQGVEAILKESSSSLRKLVVSTGCHIYVKDYRGAPFYLQLMRKVAKHSRKLEVCQLYYNAGRCGMRKDISRWVSVLVAGCCSMKEFSFWSPSGDCGGFTNFDLQAMARGWSCLVSLEVAGMDITMDGVKSLKTLKNLKSLVLQYATLGEVRRHSLVKLPEDIDALLTPEEKSACSSLESLRLVWCHLDALDLQIFLRLFPNLKTIDVHESNEVVVESDDEDNVHIASVMNTMEMQRISELQKLVRNTPSMQAVVSFSGESCARML